MVIKRNEVAICGVGINDADYVVILLEDLPRINGKRKRRKIWECPFYVKWASMIKRCYSKIQESRSPSYEGCKVCEEWLYFSNFRAWMVEQDWEGKELDKDILVPGNKVYSPNTCIFVDKRTNSFIIECTKSRGEYPIGAKFVKHVGKFAAVCNNVQTSKQEHLGYFDTPEEAHIAWLNFKLKQAEIIASQQTDERVADALIDRYKNYLNKEKEVE